MKRIPRIEADQQSFRKRAALERQTDATATQFGRFVYDLYGLTEDEIKIIEGKAS